MSPHGLKAAGPRGTGRGHGQDVCLDGVAAESGLDRSGARREMHGQRVRDDGGNFAARLRAAHAQFAGEVLYPQVRSSPRVEERLVLVKRPEHLQHAAAASGAQIRSRFVR